jgi:hypothetical protein
MIQREHLRIPTMGSNGNRRASTYAYLSFLVFLMPQGSEAQPCPSSVASLIAGPFTLHVTGNISGSATFNDDTISYQESLDVSFSGQQALGQGVYANPLTTANGTSLLTSSSPGFLETDTGTAATTGSGLAVSIATQAPTCAVNLVVSTGGSTTDTVVANGQTTTTVLNSDGSIILSLLEQNPIPLPASQLPNLNFSGTINSGLSFSFIYGDPVPLTGTISWTLTGAPPPLTLTINNTSATAFIAVPAAPTNVAYTLQADASGGLPPYLWSVNYLPPGLNLSQSGSSATISGIPTTSSPTSPISVEGEAFEFVPLPLPTTLTVTDQNGTVASATFRISIYGLPKLQNLTPSQRGDLILVGTIEMASGIVLISVTPEISAICAEIPPCLSFATALISGLLADGLADFENGVDPTDSDYTQIFQPSAPTPSPILPGQGFMQANVDALNQTLQNQAQEQGYAEAIMVSLDRVAGAQEDNSAFWATAQLQAAKWYSLQLSQHMTNAPGLLNAAVNALPVLASIQITAAQLQAFQTQVTQSGFPASVTAGNLPVLQSLLGDMSFGSTSGTLLSFISGVNSSFGLTLNQGTQQAAYSYAQFGADRNGDLQVNCADLAVVKASFGKRSGQIGFNVMADVNMDGIVDIRDLSLVSQQLPAGSVCQ